MTKAAQAFGKRLDHFWESPQTNEYMLELIDALSPNSGDKPPKITDIKRGSGLHESTGTWAHPKLAVFFARWLNARFAVWCDMQIDDILRGGRPDPFKGPTELLTHPHLVRVPVTREEHFQHMEERRKEMREAAAQRGRELDRGVYVLDT